MSPAFSSATRALAYVTDRRGALELWLESPSEGWARPLLTAADFPKAAGAVYSFLFAGVFA